MALTGPPCRRGEFREWRPRANCTIRHGQPAAARFRRLRTFAGSLNHRSGWCRITHRPARRRGGEFRTEADRQIHERKCPRSKSGVNRFDQPRRYRGTQSSRSKWGLARAARHRRLLRWLHGMNSSNLGPSGGTLNRRGIGCARIDLVLHRCSWTDHGVRDSGRRQKLVND